MAIKYLETVQELTVTDCCVCGTPFAIQSTLHKHFKQTGKGFHCPNGHRLSYSESKIERLEKALKEERSNSEWWKGNANRRSEELQQTKYKLRGTKAAYTRMKNRIAGGVCPYCNRQFENITRHMESKHSEKTKRE